MCCQKLFSVLLVLVVVGGVAPAAIPMWEYLSKDEKMSYLYSTFANQVEEFCEYSDMRNCYQELLKHGVGKLKDMPEDHLDTMDPYQRGAHNIIWDSMMQGHEMMGRRPSKRPFTTTTPKPNSYDDFRQDYQGEASAKIDNVYRVPPPPNFRPQYVYISSAPPIYRSTPKAQHHATQVASFYTPIHEEDYKHHPLTGPMVVRVHPDGTPVNEQVHLPHDEDLRQHKMSKARLPTF